MSSDESEADFILVSSTEDHSFYKKKCFTWADLLCQIPGAPSVKPLLYSTSEQNHAKATSPATHTSSYLQNDIKNMGFAAKLRLSTIHSNGNSIMMGNVN